MYRVMCFLVLLGMILPVSAKAQSAVNGYVDVHGVQVRIPGFKGMSTVGDDLPEYRMIFSQMVPSQNTLLQAFIEEENYDAATKQQAVVFNRYSMLQTMASSGVVQRPVFESLKVNVQKQFADAGSDTSPQINAGPRNNAEKGAAGLMIGGSRPLGVVFENDNVIATMQLAGFGDGGQGDPAEYALAVGVAFIFIKDRVVYLYVYSHYRNVEDILWAQETVARYAQQIQMANK